MRGFDRWLWYIYLERGIPNASSLGNARKIRVDEIIALLPNEKDAELKDVYFGSELFTSLRKDDPKQKKVLIAMFGSSGARKVAVE